jgi:hypothetical protein
MLYVDIPSLADLKSLAAYRGDICVSIYLPTTPVSREAVSDRIELKNLAKEALRQLETANADKRRVAALTEHLDDLVDDDEFWRFQARSLAVLATPDNARTFRVPNALVKLSKYRTDFTSSHCYAPWHFPIPASCWRWPKARYASFRSPPTWRPRS